MLCLGEQELKGRKTFFYHWIIPSFPVVNIIFDLLLFFYRICSPTPLVLTERKKRSLRVTGDKDCRFFGNLPTTNRFFSFTLQVVFSPIVFLCYKVFIGGCTIKMFLLRDFSSIYHRLSCLFYGMSPYKTFKNNMVVMV